ncbi:uncharacterized protein N7482_008480 [Penicillium canariense]|uniref:Enoyl reductase (ER) domain-containing protein n=1 Tax=Penicillium canariense TaxID=189055 RepID=A0A9W9HWC4_9EURO|nr:uncharacterized protein N7482_008480 [Penicillium canariense]KAJ5157380.1 hypothetical protein N7482_008480 [Penicillium canariense]
MDVVSPLSDNPPSPRDEISVIPEDDVSPSNYSESQAADIPTPGMNTDRRVSSTGKRVSTKMNAQPFVKCSMRALYYSLAPETDTSMMEPIPNGPASPKPRRFSNPGTELVLDPNFPTPQPSPQEYLLKVQTAAFCQDEMRLSAALNPPKTTPQIPLHSICGTVICSPTQDNDRPEGSKFKIGDAVWGVTSYTRDGGAADYAVATEGELAPKPGNIGAQEAAALALPGLTAWQALFRYAGIEPSTSVNGNDNGKESANAKANGIRNGHHKGSIGSGKSSIKSGRKSDNGDGHGQSLFRKSIFGGNAKSDDAHINGNANGSDYEKKNGTGNGNGHNWLRKSMDGINTGIANGQAWLMKNANSVSSGGGNGHENGAGNEYGYGARRRSWRRGSGLWRRRRGSQQQLRVLITNARGSEVGRIAVQLLRAEKLFPFPERPWICVTCTPTEGDIVRGGWDVDEVIVLPNIPAANECDFGNIFRARRWDPVDVVLDCFGGVVFQQTHSPAVVRDSGAVLTAVDPWPAQEAAIADPLDSLGRRKRGLKTMFVPVSPDAAALERIVELVESNMVRGRPEQVTDLMHADTLLKDHALGAGAARRGLMMVVRVN